MPKSFKPTVLIVLFLAVAFTVFFFVSKHNQALVHINPFADDPFDAVGSFGVQLTLFTALLSMIRVYIPHVNNEMSASQKLLVIRGCTVSVQSVAVTLAVYVVAMIRYYNEWIFAPDGRILAFMVAGMTILAAITAWRIDLLAYNAGLSSDLPSRRMALINCLVGILILGIYPAEWRQGPVGAVATAVLGVLLLLFLTWSLAAALSPRIDIHIEDFLDDIAGVDRALKAKGKTASRILDGIANIFAKPPLAGLVRTFNPRKHVWRFAVLVALVAGVLLALFESLRESTLFNSGRFAVIVAVFIGIEGAGVLLGHVLFTRYLGIFRQED